MLLFWQEYFDILKQCLKGEFTSKQKYNYLDLLHLWGGGRHEVCPLMLPLLELVHTA